MPHSRHYITLFVLRTLLCGDKNVGILKKTDFLSLLGSQVLARSLTLGYVRGQWIPSVFPFQGNLQNTSLSFDFTSLPSNVKNSILYLEVNSKRRFMIKAEKSGEKAGKSGKSRKKQEKSRIFSPYCRTDGPPGELWPPPSSL